MFSRFSRSWAGFTACAALVAGGMWLAAPESARAAQSRPASVTDMTYRGQLFNRGSTLCLDGRASGVRMARCGVDLSYQTWLSSNTAYFRLETSGGHLCLDGRARGVTMQTCGHDGSYEVWSYVPLAFGTELRNGSDLCLDGRASGVHMTRCTPYNNPPDWTYEFWVQIAP